MFILPLNAVGLPKNMNSLPGTSFSYIHLIPLKKTVSISPEPSEIHTLILFTVLNFIAFSFAPAPSPGASILPDELPKSSTRITLALIWRYAMSGLASAILTTELLSIYLNG